MVATARDCLFSTYNFEYPSKRKVSIVIDSYFGEQPIVERYGFRERELEKQARVVIPDDLDWCCLHAVGTGKENSVQPYK